MDMAFIWQNKYLGLLCGIGVQITNIIIVVLYLFFDISRELLGACWVTSLIVVLFVSGGIGSK